MKNINQKIKLAKKYYISHVYYNYYMPFLYRDKYKQSKKSKRMIKRYHQLKDLSDYKKNYPFWKYKRTL